MSIKRINKELEYFLKRKYVLDDILENLRNFYSNIKIDTFMITRGYNNEDNLHIEITKNNSTINKSNSANLFHFYQIYNFLRKLMNRISTLP